MGLQGAHVTVHLGGKTECWGECLTVPRIGEELWFGEGDSAELYLVESVVWGSDFETGQYAEVWLLEDPEVQTVDDLVKIAN